MNYEDELERVKARRSRRRQNSDSAAADGGAAESGIHGVSSYDSLSDSSAGMRSRRNPSMRKTELRSKEAESGSHGARTGGNGGSGGGNVHVSGYQGPRRRKKPEKNKKKTIIRVVIAVVVLLLAAVFGVWAYIHYLFARSNNNEINSDKLESSINLNQEMRDEIEKGYWTFAVFGVDSRDNSTGKGNQADVIMIVNINRETGEIKLVSVFRDTYLNISEKNTYNKVNAAYAQGGPEQAMMALNKNLDLSITQYATFNWKAVATGINILGGVDIDISKSEFYYINAFITETVKGTGIGSTQLTQAGLNHLDGVQAVAYGRLRLMDTDYARTERQRLVIQKAFEKAKDADIATLNSLVGNMFALCSTNINELDVLKMAGNINKYHLGETTGFPAARGEQKIKIGNSYGDCVIPQTLESNVISLHEFLYGSESYTPSSTVKSISSKISEISGLYKAGEEIGHVPTDQGYIPKSTTAAAEEETSESAEELEQSSEGESSSEETSESGSEGIIIAPGELGPGMSMETDEDGEFIVSPTTPTTSAHTQPSTTEEFRPSSPADLATMQTTEGAGPGSEPTTASVPEATTSPASQSSAASGGSSVIVAPTTAASPTTASSPTVEIIQGTSGGPASSAP